MRAVGSINHSEGYNRWLHRMRGLAFRRAVHALRLRPKRVLDIGSGAGFYLEQWQRIGVPEIVGSDIAAAAAHDLTIRFPGLDIHRLDIAQSCELGDFDAVSAFDVLFHIVSEEGYTAALRNIRDVLTPGGVFLFSEHLPRHPVTSRPHRVSRTLGEVSERLSDVGFEVLLRRPTFRLMFPPNEPERYPLLDRLWRGPATRLASSDRAGAVLGAALFPLETLCTRVAREGPHTQLVAARRRP